jgi:hypothetical protein
MTLQLHRPDGRGGIERRTVRDDAWRKTLRSPRWGSSLRRKQLPELKNPEMNPTPTWRAVLFWVALAAATFVLLIAGYGLNAWK